MLLVLIRAVFVLVIGRLGVRMTARSSASTSSPIPISSSSGSCSSAIVVVVVDLLTPRKRIQTISAVYIGVIVGIFLTNLFTDALQPTHAALPGPPGAHDVLELHDDLHLLRLHLDAAANQG